MTDETNSTESPLVLKVLQDQEPLNPRTDWDNLGTMALFHKRYTLGDEGHGLYTSDFEGWEEMEDHLYRKCDAAVVLPVYMYDHSGITIQTRPFSCGWDSGQVGFIFMSNAKAREAWGVKRISKKLLGKITEALECEVKVYDQYLTGDVWGYVVETEDGEHVDSCWGFFGEEEARSEGESALKWHEQPAQAA